MNRKLIFRQVTSFFIGIDSLFWLCYAALTAFDLHPALPDNTRVRLITGLLALGTGLAMPVLLFLSRKHSPRWLWLLLAGLALILFLTAADEFGWTDLIVFVFHFIPFGMLIYDIIPGRRRLDK